MAPPASRASGVGLLVHVTVVGTVVDGFVLLFGLGTILNTAIGGSTGLDVAANPPSAREPPVATEDRG